MNRSRERIRVVLALGACLAGAGAANPQSPQAQIPGPGVKPTVPPIVKQCRDPAAVSVTFVVLSLEPGQPGVGRIRITGVVRNVGNADFGANPKEAEVQLVETPRGLVWGQRIPPGIGPGAVVRARQAIAKLARGAELSLSYECAWNGWSQPGTTFTLLISCDPRNQNDANPHNDDCNLNNNSRDLTGGQIILGWPRAGEPAR